MEDEFRALQTYAAAPRAMTDQLLLSADRFLADDAAVELTPLQRRHLLDRLGIFGVRVALPFIRLGRCTGARELAEALLSRSGIDSLRAELLDRFAARRDVLRGRSAMLALRSILTSHANAAAAQLMRDIERLAAGEHAFAEIRLMNDHRRGLVPFAAKDLPAVENLLGAQGTSPAALVGLPPGSSNAEIEAALLTAIEHWRRRQESPFSSRELSEAARVLVRTCEGAFARLGNVKQAI